MNRIKLHAKYNAYIWQITINDLNKACCEIVNK